MSNTLGYGDKVSVRAEAIADHHADHYTGKVGVVINSFDGGEYVNVLWEACWTSLWKAKELKFYEAP